MNEHKGGHGASASRATQSVTALRTKRDTLQCRPWQNAPSRRRRRAAAASVSANNTETKCTDSEADARVLTSRSSCQQRKRCCLTNVSDRPFRARMSPKKSAEPPVLFPRTGIGTLWTTSVLGADVEVIYDVHAMFQLQLHVTFEYILLATTNKRGLRRIT